MKKIILIYAIIIVLIFTSCNSVQNNNSDNCELCWGSGEWYNQKIIETELTMSEYFTKENMENIEYVIDDVKYMLKYQQSYKNNFYGELDIYECYDSDKFDAQKITSTYMEFKNGTLVCFYGIYTTLDDCSKEEAVTEEQAIEKAKLFLESENVSIEGYKVSVKEGYDKYDISFMSSNIPDYFTARTVIDGAYVGIKYSGGVYYYKAPLITRTLEKYNLSFDVNEMIEKAKQQAIELLQSKGECENFTFDDPFPLISTYIEYTEDLGPCFKKDFFVNFDVDGDTKGTAVRICFPIEQ